MTGPLDHLLAVQDIDTSMSQLRHRRDTLADTVGLTPLVAEIRSLEAGRAAAQERRAALLATQKDLEQQIGALTERRSAIEQRMYAATSSSGRDLQAMSDEVRHLTERRAELEERELAAMLEQDPIDAELAARAERLTPLDAQATELRARMATEVQEIDAALDEAGRARASEAAQVPTALLDRYEALRARLKGTGAARLVGNRCDGCHLELSAVEVERIHALSPDEVATCEQCGRILVPA